MKEVTERTLIICKGYLKCKTHEELRRKLGLKTDTYYRARRQGRFIKLSLINKEYIKYYCAAVITVMRELEERR